MDDILPLFLEALQSMVTVLAIYGVAMILARRKLLDELLVGKLSKLVTVLFLPALTFKSIAGEFSIDHIKELWPISVIGLGYTVIGFMAAELLALFAKPTPSFRPWFVMAVTWPNVMAMPLVFAAAICSAQEADRSAVSRCKDGAVARYYTYTLTFAFLTFTVSYKYVNTRLDWASQAKQNSEAACAVPDAQCNDTMPAAGSVAYDDINIRDPEAGEKPAGIAPGEPPSGKHLEIQPDSATMKEAKGADNPQTEPCKETVRPMQRLQQPRHALMVWRFIADSFLNPPVISNFISQALAYTEASKLFFGEDAPLRSITTAIILLADSTTALLNMVTGASLAHQLMKLKSYRDILGGDDVGISRQTMCFLVASRILVMPLVFYVITLCILDGLPADRWARLALFIQPMCPTAPMIMVLAQIMGKPRDAQLMSLSLVPQFILFVPVSLFFITSGLNYTDELRVPA